MLIDERIPSHDEHLDQYHTTKAETETGVLEANRKVVLKSAAWRSITIDSRR